MNIDWSKAPEGATHYLGAGELHTRFRDCSGEFWRYFDQLTGQWTQIKLTSSTLLRRTELVQRPTPEPAWSGEDLPPVGAVCEFAGGEDCPHDPWDKDLRVGDQVTIIAHFDGGNGDQLAAFTFPTKNPNRGAFNVEQGRWGCFRPIRTPEQIAAKERAKCIADMCRITESHIGSIMGAAFGKIYDAGYRKQEQE